MRTAIYTTAAAAMIFSGATMLHSATAEAGASADLTTRVEEYVRWLKS